MDTSSKFQCARQRPTHDPEEVEHLGPVDYPRFLGLLRSIDWRHEANQSEWANKASPTLAVTNQDDGCTCWVSSIVAGSVVSVDRDPDEDSCVDGYATWFHMEMKSPPEIPNVTSLNLHGIENNLGFTTASLEPVEECFELFFKEDYVSLYEMFRWI